MVSTKTLLRQARESGNREAYASVARGRGFRIGIGARAAQREASRVFVEVVLDPFPERPHVSAERLAEQANLVRRLQARGYVVACDADSTITCERGMTPARVPEEIRSVKRLLRATGGADGRS